MVVEAVHGLHTTKVLSLNTILIITLATTSIITLALYTYTPPMCPLNLLAFTDMILICRN